MFFEKKVDLRSKRAMADFLKNHFRYATMNSWNRGNSYANRIKVHHLGLTKEQEGRAWKILSIDCYADFWNEIRYPIDNFTAETGGAYTIGSNGRSGGYLVLYRGEYHDPGYKSRCCSCGQLNFQLVPPSAADGKGQCGRCGKHERINLTRSLRWHRVLGGGIDDDCSLEDLMELSVGSLRDKVELVQLFDRTCDDIRANFIDLLENSTVVEETVMVPKTVKRIVFAEAA